MSNRLATFARSFNALVFRGALDADWREDQHKRDQGGKFSSTGAGGGAKGEASEPSLRQMLGSGEPRFAKGAKKPQGRSQKRIEEKAALKKVQGQKYSGAVNSASEWLRRNGGESAAAHRELSPEQIGNLKSIAGDLLKILRDAGHAQVSETKVAAPAKEKKPKTISKTLPTESIETLPGRRRVGAPAKPKAEKKPKAPIDVGAHAEALKASAGNEQSFRGAFSAIQKMSKADLLAIANTFATKGAEQPKSASKKRLLDFIEGLHKNAREFDMKLKAMGGRSAA